MVMIPYLELSFGTDFTQDPRVKRASFGDGYSQRKRDGINSTPQTWGLKWDNIPDATAETLRVFFAGLGGSDVLEWQPYGQPYLLKWTATKFRGRPTGYQISSCSVQLDQEFDL
jgi:phage-related protein